MRAVECREPLVIHADTSGTSVGACANQDKTGQNRSEGEKGSTQKGVKGTEELAA